MVFFLLFSIFIFAAAIFYVKNQDEFSNIINQKEKNKLLVWGWAINKDRKKMEKMARYFLSTARKHKISPELIGIGWEYADWDDPVVDGDGSKAGHGLQRFYVLREKLRGLDDDIPILVMDAGDTLINGTGEEILKRFKKFNTQILFSAEAMYTYQYMENKEKYDKMNPRTKYKYIAAGTFIGYAGSLREMVEDCIVKCCTDQESKLYNAIEMNILGIWVHERLEKKKKVQLDIFSKLFWVTSNDADNYLNTLYSKGKQFYNSHTGTYPIIYHLVGGPTRKKIEEGANKILSFH